jgi:hypothetical protein
MSPEDQARYGHPIQPKDAFADPGIHPAGELQHKKPDVPEIAEQREFAKWCATQNYRAVWHRTHKRSTANRGCPDFIVGAKGSTFWIEFKRPGEELAPDQSVFKTQLANNGITMYVCYSCAEAQAVIQQYNGRHLR